MVAIGKSICLQFLFLYSIASAIEMFAHANSTLQFRKYVPINPHAFGMNSCAKAYVNVHSSSVEEPYAIICCPTATNTSTNTKYWSWIMGSYEVALCAGKVREWRGFEKN